MILAGFYNNEDPKAFSPAPIQYASVNLGEVQKQLLRYAATYEWSRPTTVITADETRAL